MKRYLAVLGLVISSISAGLFAAPAAQAKVDVPEITDQHRVWIYGKLAQGYSCWTRGTKDIQLQIRNPQGKWVTVATGYKYKDGRCKTRKYPIQINYVFEVTEMGTRLAEGTRAYLTEARELTPSGKAFNFTKQVYASEADHAKDLADTFCEALTGQPCEP